jgi:hypothetical protein
MIEALLIVVATTSTSPTVPAKPSGYTPSPAVSPPASPKPVYVPPSPSPQPVYTPPPSESWSDKMWRRYKEFSK